MNHSITLSILEDTGAPEGDALVQGLVRFNRSVAEPPNWKAFLISAKDEDGNLVGGVKGHSQWGWLFVSHLWVDEDQRGNGLGSRLMEQAEEIGRSRGCKGAWLDTFSFQALPFYKKIGYEEFGSLEDFPPGSTRHFLRKTL